MINRLVWALLLMALLGHPEWAAAQSAKCTTKPARIAKTLNGKDAYALGKAEAAKAIKDSALVRMQTPNDGPLDLQGRSAQWMLQFFSPAAKKLTLVFLMAGAMTCSTTPIEVSPQALEETAETIFDTERLVSIAREAGGSALDPQKLSVNSSLTRSGPDAPAIWAISYVTPQGQPVLQVMIHSVSGIVTSKFPR